MDIPQRVDIVFLGTDLWLRKRSGSGSVVSLQRGNCCISIALAQFASVGGGAARPFIRAKVLHIAKMTQKRVYAAVAHFMRVCVRVCNIIPPLGAKFALKIMFKFPAESFPARRVLVNPPGLPFARSCFASPGHILFGI